MDITSKLSEFAVGIGSTALPENVKAMLRALMLDYFSACYAGMRVNPEFNSAVSELICERGGREEASVIFGSGITQMLPAESAAFINAVYAHGADIDDGNRRAMGHIGAHVFSAVFAFAEYLNRIRKADISGNSIFNAALVGYEIYDRISAAVQPGAIKRGFHSTGTAGAIACAAACAKLADLPCEKMYSAISLAALQSSGLLLIAESGQSCKPLNPANAARTGIFSARLAEKGVSAPSRPLESDKGWLHAMSDDAVIERITDGLGTEYTVCDCYIKPYPSCRHTHAVIQCAVALRKRLVKDISSICAVKIFTYPNAISVAGQIRVPTTDEDTKFSIHYALAYALENGNFGISALSLGGLTDTVRALIARTECIPDQSLEMAERGIRGACVEIVTADGEKLSETVLIPKGDASDPMSHSELISKLENCSEGILQPSDREKLILGISELENSSFTSLNGLFKAQS